MIDYMEKRENIKGQYCGNRIKTTVGSNQVETQREAEGRYVLAPR